MNFNISTKTVHEFLLPNKCLVGMLNVKCALAHTNICSFIFHHMLVIVTALNFFWLRSRFQHQPTLYILIYCAIYGGFNCKQFIYISFGFLFLLLIHEPLFWSSTLVLLLFSILFISFPISYLNYRTNQFPWKITGSSIKLRVFKIFSKVISMKC